MSLKSLCIAPFLALLLVGCEPKPHTFKGEVPTAAQNANSPAAKSNMENNVEVIEYTFYKFPPPLSAQAHSDKASQPERNRLTPEEIRRYNQALQAHQRDQQLNKLNAQIKAISDEPLPHELDQLIKIDQASNGYTKNTRDMSIPSISKD